MQGELVIIELPHSPIKFRSTLIKPYFDNNTSIDDHQPMPDASGPSPLIQASPTEAPPIQVPLTQPSASAPLASLVLINHGRGQPRKQ